MDTTSPVIAISGSSPVTVEAGSIYTDAGATATDNGDGDLTGSIVTLNGVDTATLGSYKVTYNVTDSSGHVATEITRTVDVVDTTPPVLSVSTTVYVNEGTTATITASATDTGEGNITYTFSGWMNSSGNISTGQSFSDSRVTTNTDYGSSPYDVTVTVSDGTNNASQLVKVYVLNIVLVSWNSSYDIDPGDGTLVSGVEGYKIYYRPSGTGTYTLAGNGDVGNVTSVVLSNLIIPTGLNDIVVRAYDHAGHESANSNVKTYNVP